MTRFMLAVYEGFTTPKDFTRRENFIRMWKSSLFDLLQFHNAEVGDINRKKRKLLKPLIDGTITIDELKAQAGDNTCGLTIDVNLTMLGAMDNMIRMNAPDDVDNILLDDMGYVELDDNPYVAALFNEASHDENAMDFTPTKMDLRLPQSER